LSSYGFPCHKLEIVVEPGNPKGFATLADQAKMVDKACTRSGVEAASSGHDGSGTWFFARANPKGREKRIQGQLGGHEG